MRQQTPFAMVNYRRVVYEVAALGALLALAAAAPLNSDCKEEYNQSQNGTENFRVHVNGLVIAMMPAESFAESLLSAMPDLEELLESEGINQLQQQKPKPPMVTSPPKPEEKPQTESEVLATSENPKPTESAAPLSDVSIKSDTPHNKEASANKQKRPQRYVIVMTKAEKH